MLKRFEVRGFKNFENNFVLDFSKVRDYKFNNEAIYHELVNTAVIYGKNAVGKTNLGRAIMGIQQNIFGDVFMQSHEDYLNADMSERNAEFCYEFKFSNNEVIYRYCKNQEAVLEYEELLINENIIYKYSHVNSEMLEENLKLINADTLNWEFIENVPSILAYIANNVSLQNDSPIRQLYLFIRQMRMIRGNLLSSRSLSADRIVKDIIKYDLVDDFEHFLNKFNVDEKLAVIDIDGENKILCFDHKRPINFLNNCSSGTLSLLQLYSWYRNFKNTSFLYLDEFDAFYHHELSIKMIEMFKEITNCQIVTTSHNTDLLTNKIMRPDCLFIMTKNKIVSLPEATSRELREGHNLEKLYKSGEFDE